MTRVFGHYVAKEIVTLLLAETAISCAVFALLVHEWVVSSGTASDLNDGWRMPALVAAACAIVGACILSAVGLYRRRTALEMHELMLNAALGGAIALLPLLIAVSVAVRALGVPPPSTMWVSKTLLTWMAAIAAVRVLMKAAVEAGFWHRRVLLLGNPAISATTASPKGSNIRVTRWTNAHEPPPITYLTDNGIDTIVVTKDDVDQVPAGWMIECRRARVKVETHDEYLEKQVRRIDVDHLPQHWLVSAPAYPPSQTAAAVRRAFDVAIAVVLLVMTMPISLVAAIAIRVDSNGPVIYSQERVGLDGRLFRIRKFRSMRTDAEASGAVWATKKDSRVTKVGAFLRKCRIDEIPQLVNVIEGTMSLIGPRPERPEFVERLKQEIPHFGDRELVKPGMTGWAQVNFSYTATIEETKTKLSYDLYYIKNRSLFLDLVIMLQTFRVMVFAEGSR